jgi:micrococcal nuclease
VRLAAGTTASVRPIGIDTPETKKPDTPVECGGPAATARMKKLALRNGRGLSVTVKSDPTQDRRDRFGRLLAYVSSASVDFGRTMVLSGWARSYVYEESYERVNTYRSAHSSARNTPRGVWRQLPPSRVARPQVLCGT